MVKDGVPLDGQDGHSGSLVVGWNLLTVLKKNPAWPLPLPCPGGLEETHGISACPVCEPLYLNLKKTFYLCSFVYMCVCVYPCAGVHALACVWRLEDSWWELVLSFHHVSSEDQTQVLRL